MLPQLTFDDALAARDVTIARVHENAGDEFSSGAKWFVIAYLNLHGPTPGEEITDACKLSGITPHDDRAFGAVYKSLSAARKIERAGYCLRRKGHATAGGIIWRLVTA